MEQKSLFSRYYSMCMSMILATIATLGLVLLAFVSRHFETDKFGLLARNVEQAVSLTMADLEANDYRYVTSGTVLGGYTILGTAIDADIFLVDTTGKTLLCTELGRCGHTQFYVDPEIMQKVLRGDYHEVGKLGKIYNDRMYTVGRPLITANGEVAGAVFASTSASVLTDFLWDILKMFTLSALAVALAAFLVIYYVTGRMVKPLQEMVTATEQFAKGDFSVRVPVEGFDEIGKLAMAFNNMVSSLTTLESTRRSFVANVSHELKTPMTTIGGFIDGILDGTIPPEKERQYLSIVSTEVKRLSRLVRSMLDVAKIEAGEMQITLAPVDITDVVMRTVFTFEKAIEEKELEVRGLDSARMMVLADVDLIHQVIYNLTDNAVKFVNHGGYLEFSYETQGDMAYIGVKNSGEGIGKEEITHIFDRFYKTDKSRSLDKNGVGLGLHIVRSIVNLHGGEIMVRSAEGEYCEFIFTLKTAPSKSSQSLFRKADKNKKNIDV